MCGCRVLVQQPDATHCKLSHCTEHHETLLNNIDCPVKLEITNHPDRDSQSLFGCQTDLQTLKTRHISSHMHNLVKASLQLTAESSSRLKTEVGSRLTGYQPDNEPGHNVVRIAAWRLSWHICHTAESCQLGPSLWSRMTTLTWTWAHFSRITPAEPCRAREDVFLHDSSLIRHLSDVYSIWCV